MYQIYIHVQHLTDCWDKNHLFPRQWCQRKPENQRNSGGFVGCQVNRQIKGRQSSDLEATFHLRERLLEVPTVFPKNPISKTGLVFRCQKEGDRFFWSCGRCVFFVWEGEIRVCCCWFLFIYKEMKMRLQGFFLGWFLKDILPLWFMI